MLSEYEAAMLAKQKSADSVRNQPRPSRNRIAAVLVALSVLSAVGLLYTAFFHRGQDSSVVRAGPAAPVTAPIVHPRASGLPEAALFSRQGPREGEASTTADMAVSAR
jgi:hypothetical protein